MRVIVAISNELFTRAILQLLVDENNVIWLGIGVDASRFDTVVSIGVEALLRERVVQQLPVGDIVFNN